MSNDKALSWSYTEEIIAEPEHMAAARQQAHDLGTSVLSPATGNFLAAVAASPAVKTIAEIGTGTGVSGLYLLSGSPDSTLTTIDIDTEAQTYAREAFASFGVRNGRFRLINGRSADILPRLANNSYDLVLIDADAMEADGDAAEAIRMLRRGGILIVTHALNNDRVADPAKRDEVTVAMRNLGKELIADESLITSLLPLGDGLLYCVKR